MTGASEGIGRGYALEVCISYTVSVTGIRSENTNVCRYFQLARQGLNVVIMSRSEEKLQKVAEEIRKYNKIHIPQALKNDTVDVYRVLYSGNFRGRKLARISWF